MEFFGWKFFKKKSLDTVFFNRSCIYDVLLPKDKVVIFDVGANIGQSVIEFKGKRPNAVIYSFEPASENFEKLEKVAKQYENCYIFKSGLGATDNRLELTLYADTGSNSFIPIDVESVAVKLHTHPKVNRFLSKEIKSEICDITTLDTFCGKNGIDDIDLIKIDVQGFENDVLDGAKDAIANKKIKIILIEIIFDDQYGGNSFYNIESRLLKHGYVLYDISHIYKDINVGMTSQVDAVYVLKDYLSIVMEERINAD